MQELLELIMLFRQEPSALGALRSVLLEPGSKTEILFDAIYHGKLDSDEAAEALLYGKSEGTQAKYQALKSRLKDKLIQCILLSDLNGEEFSDREMAHVDCQKKWAAAMTLFSKGAATAAAELSEQLLKRTRRYEFTELSISILHRLCHYYALQYGKAKKYEEYRSLQKHFQRIWLAEKEAEDYVNDIAATYKPTLEIRLQLATTAERAYAELAPLLEASESYSLHLSGRTLQTFFHMYRGEYQEAANVCKEALQFFEKRKYKTTVPSQLFYYQLIVCQIQLKQFDEGYKTIKKQQEAFSEGSWNWYKFQELLFLLSMHTGAYDTGFKVLQQAITAKNFEKIPEMLQESWRIYEAFGHFLLKIGKIKAPAGTSKYKTGKFLNEVPEFSKDKRGANVPVLIVQLLHALADNKRDQLIDRVEALSKYCSRYLKDDTQYRSNCFINMLMQIPGGNFHKEAVLRKADKYSARLSERSVQIADQAFELEVIPYESLWELVVGILPTK